MSTADWLMNMLKLESAAFRADQPGRWPLPLRVASCAVAALLVLMLLTALWLASLYQQARQLHQSEQDLKQVLVEQYQQRQHVTEYRELVRSLRATPEYLDGLLNEQGAPLLLDYITRNALRHELLLDEVRLLPEQAGDVHFLVPVRIRAIGDYAALSGFIADISSGAIRLSLHDFELKASGPDPAGGLLLDMEAHAYRLAERIL